MMYDLLTVHYILFTVCCAICDGFCFFVMHIFLSKCASLKAESLVELQTLLYHKSNEMHVTGNL